MKWITLGIFLQKMSKCKQFFNFCSKQRARFLNQSNLTFRGSRKVIYELFEQDSAFQIFPKEIIAFYYLFFLPKKQMKQMKESCTHIVLHFSNKKKHFFQSRIISQMATKTKPGETRGRPKKEDSRTLPTISKRLFPEDLAVVSACCLIYVFEIFVDTRKERRVGHKDGGFTMFQKLSSQYSFDSYQNDLKEWDCDDLLKIESMQPFLLQLPGLGPKPILKQLTIFIMSILKQHIQEGKAEEQIEHELLDSEVVASDYPNMRFVPETLLNLKLDKGGVQDYEERVEAKVNELWPSFVRIMVYTVINSYKAISYNKYFKPFFSDAPNPQQTHIGQLNLTQIVTTVERQEENQRLKNGNFPLEIKKPRNERILVIVDAKKENEQKNEVKQEDKIKQQWERQNQMLEGKRQREQEDKIEPRPRKISPLLVEANNFHLFKSQKNQEV